MPGAKAPKEEQDEETIEEQRQEAEELDTEDARRYWAVAARPNYLAADRVDIKFSAKEAARAMSAPLKRHWHLLNKIGRYLIGTPRLIIKFPWQERVDVVTTYTDSD